MTADDKAVRTTDYATVINHRTLVQKGIPLFDGPSIMVGILATRSAIVKALLS